MLPKFVNRLTEIDVSYSFKRNYFRLVLLKYFRVTPTNQNDKNNMVTNGGGSIPP